MQNKSEAPGAAEEKDVKIYLVGLHENEDVVHPDSQHQEWDDFDDNEGQRHPHVTEDAQGAGHWAQHYQDPRDAQWDLRIHLISGKGTDHESFVLPNKLNVQSTVRGDRETSRFPSNKRHTLTGNSVNKTGK